MKKSIYWRVATGAALLLFGYIFWQWRYEKISQNLVPKDACQNAQHWQGMTTAPTVSFSADGLVIHKKLGGPNSSVFIPLGDLGDARHIAVKCDVAWENCQKDPKIYWAMPRIVIFGNNAAGHFHSAADHGVVAARGTRKWHREHCVMELPPGMKNARISIDTYGIQGTLRVKHLHVELVRPRVWSEIAGIILLACWLQWLAWNLHPLLRGNYRALRSLLLGSALLASFATFVFPQPRSLERSIGLQFWLGSGPIAPPTPPPSDVELSNVEHNTAQTPAAHPSSQPKGSRLRTLPPPTDEELHAPPPSHSQSTPSAPIPQAKSIVIDPPSRWEALRASAREQLMAMDRKWNFRSYNLTHFTSFFAISCCILLLARRVRLLWIVGAMAVSAEIIPDLVHDVGDSGDFYDLLANALGIIAALLLHRMFSYFLSKRRKKYALADQALSDKA